MKTKDEIVKWIDMMLSFHPNVEDANFFKSIKHYLTTDTTRLDKLEKDVKHLKSTMKYLLDALTAESDEEIQAIERELDNNINMKGDK